MVAKEALTNEGLLKDRFDSTFEFVNYAIHRAEDMIKTGRTTYVYTDIQNPAVQILLEIAERKDLQHDIYEDEDEDEDDEGEEFVDIEVDEVNA